MSREFHHVTVLLKEAVDGLLVRQGGTYIDMTLGGGGHSGEILRRGGTLIGIDKDENAINAARAVLPESGNNFTLVKSDFKDVKKVIEGLGIEAVDGIIMDLGVSSHQLDEAERGFSYMNDGLLDMRMDRQSEFSAKDVVNHYDEKKLFGVISDYGEERWAKRIAEFIVAARKKKEIETTGELVSIIKAAVPKGARLDGPHPAKRTFQAIRIEVNGELEILEKSVTDAIDILKPGGRISIITFHSLEDRCVKNTYAQLHKGCICPPEYPVCVCGKTPQIKIITKKPMLPTEEEIEVNPRARSAKLRIAEKKGK